MTNEMVLERTSNLVMPSNCVELDMDEVAYVDGGAWWVVVGWICQGIGLGLGIASSAVSMAGCWLYWKYFNWNGGVNSERIESCHSNS